MPLQRPMSLVRSTDGSEPTWPTQVEVSWTGRGLHVRFECRDDLAWGTHANRDAPLWQEEVVEAFLAPVWGQENGKEHGKTMSLLETPRLYAELELSPRGVLFDARVLNPDGDRATMQVEEEWDWPGVEWRAGTLPRRQDWWAELFLPWQGLAALEPERPSVGPPELLRANFFRVERPAGAAGPGDEYSAWSPTLVNPPDFHRPQCFGLLAPASALESEAGKEDIEGFRASGLPVRILPITG